VYIMIEDDYPRTSDTSLADDKEDESDKEGDRRGDK
jgi:hypothetical protein